MDSLRHILIRPSKYLVVGAFCALMHNAILIAGAAAGISYVIGMFVSYVVCGAVGYHFHVSFTFRSTYSRAGYLRFMGGQATGFLLSFALMGIMCTGLSWPVWIATPIATVLLFAFNYTAAHWAIVR